MSALSQHGRRLFARRYLGVARPEEAIDWAAAELSAGSSTAALRILAGLDRAAKPRRVEGYLTSAIQELGLGLPNQRDCLLAYARDVAGAVGSGTLGPADGLGELAQIARALADPGDLSPFLFLADGVDPQGYAELKGPALDAAIVAECREFLQEETLAATEKPAEPIMRCPSCLEVNEPAADFCRKCGMPLTAIAAMDPLKQVYAQGWVYRHAVGGRPSALAVWGMWLIFGPVVICDVVGGSGLISSMSDKARLLGTVLSGAIMVLYLAILYRVTTRYLQYRLATAGRCVECGHDLRGLTGNRCPECGTPFDPEDLRA